MDRSLFTMSEPLAKHVADIDADGNDISEGSFSKGGTSLHKCESDGDLQRKLTVRPDFNAHIFPDKHLVVFAREQHTQLVLKGEIYTNIVPLLCEGKYNNDQIVRKQEGTHDEIIIRTALYRLASLNIIISAEHDLNPQQSFYWSCLNISPAAASARLAAHPIYLASLGNKHSLSTLRAQMQNCGWRFVDNEDKAKLILYLTDSYMISDLADINARRRDDRKCWALVQLDSPVLMFGPVFNPAAKFKNRPCWECLNSRFKHGEHGNSVKMQNLTGSITHKHQNDYSIPQQIVASHLLGGLSAWLVDTQNAALSGHLITVTAPYEKSEYHWVKQLPQCSVCGDQSLLASNRKPTVPQLRTSVDMKTTSGGRRAEHPQKIVNRYKRHISLITGIVERLQLVRGSYLDPNAKQNDWYFVTFTGDNRALRQKYLKELDGGVRLASGGKGDSAVQAQASGLCEAIERHCFIYRGGEEITHRAAYSDFASDEVIHPNSIAMYSEDQFDKRQEINADRKYFVPLPLDPKAAVDWTPVWSLSQQRFKYVLTTQLYFQTGAEVAGANPPYTLSDSNGCAAGSCLEDAVMQGFCELIERDAIAIWWYNRLRMPGVDLHSFDIPYLQHAEKFYHNRLQRKIWLLDLTHDLGVPVFVALSARLAEDGYQRFISGAGANPDPRIAAMRAVSELNQGVLFDLTDNSRNSKLPDYHYEISAWLRKPQDKRDNSYDYLLPHPDLPLTKQADYPPVCKAGAETDYLRKKTEAKGMEVLLLDQTRPDIGLPVVKVIVPGLRHWWCRLAPGRLYDVPVAQGLLPEKIPETATNPIRNFW